MLLVALGSALAACGGQPVLGDKFSDKRHYGIHGALDVSNGFGKPVIAMADGVVTNVEDREGPHRMLYGKGVYGRVVQVKSGDFVLTLNHTKPAVEFGKEVRRGDVIGYTDQSGVDRYGNKGSHYPHVHIQMNENDQWGKRLDPIVYIVGCYDPATKYEKDQLTYPVECTND